MALPLRAALNAQTGGNLDEQGSANAWAGTSGLSTLAALNTKAGTNGVGWVQTIQSLNTTFSLGAVTEWTE